MIDRRRCLGGRPLDLHRREEEMVFANAFVGECARPVDLGYEGVAHFSGEHLEVRKGLVLTRGIKPRSFQAAWARSLMAANMPASRQGPQAMLATGAPSRRQLVP